MSETHDSYSTAQAVAWMRSRIIPGMTAAGLAAAYQDAHSIAPSLWREMFFDAVLALRLGPAVSR